MRRFITTWATLAAVSLLCAASRVEAQSAQDLYDQGVRSLAAGKYGEAVQSLDASYRKQPNANTLYSLGLGYKGMGHPDKALESFESYVKFADPKKDAKSISAVRAEVERLKAAYARFGLKLSPADAKIEIDGVAQTPSHGELWVPIGKHKIIVRADGYDTYEQSLDVAAGHFDLEIQLRQPTGTPAERAALLVDEGVALQAASNLLPAMEKYKAAQVIYPTPRAAGQLGLAEESMTMMPEAEQHLSEALKSPKDPFIRENKKKLKAALERVKKHIATLTVTGTPDGAEVFVNGKSIGLLPIGGPTRVSSGSLTITAKKEGYSDYEELIDLPPRGQRRVKIEMSEAPPPPVVAAVPLIAPSPEPPPPVVAAVPALTEQPPAEAVPAEKPKDTHAPAQADIEAQAEQPQEPEPTAKKSSATGFELALNFGYQPWLGAKTDGSSGLLVPQLVMGARVLWPLSFGVMLTGGFDTGAKGASVVAAANPTIYVRGHVQQYKKRLGLDAWGGVGIQPVAMQFSVLKATSLLSQHVHTVQSINVPFELGGSFFVTEGFGFDLA
ncbi:MAG: PEGA domain-containing protein, partial [Polyangiales bacterium]